MELFRSAVIENQKPKLYGEVLIPQHLPYTFLIGILSLYFSLMLLVVIFGTFTRSEQAIGHLVPSNGLIKIFPAQTGIISNIFVHERQFVSAGTPLISIKLDYETQYGMSSIERGIIALDEKRTLLKESKNILADNLNTKAVNIHSNISVEKSSIQALNKQLFFQLALTESAKNTYVDSTKLLKNGYISRLEAERRKQAFLASQQSEEILRQDIKASKSKLEILKNNLAKLSIECAEGINKINSDIMSINQNKSELEGRQSYMIKAPVSGQIASMISTIGRNTNPNIPLLTILPENSELIAEIFVPSRAIGFVTEDQNVRLALDAFPYEKFGSIPARIFSVSSTILRPLETGAAFKINEPVYRATALLESQFINYHTRKIALQPGMQFQATIILEKTGLFDWIISPLKAVGERL